MRLISQNINRRDGSGDATLMPEEPEDMWHAYNLIQPRDILRAPAIRKLVSKGEDGSSRSKRIHTSLTIQIKSLDFDPGAGQLHVSGIVAEENEFVAQGSAHTLDLELHRNFRLEKADGWDSVALELLKEATDPTRRVQVWAVVMQEGLANICLITENQTILRQRVEVPIPRKRKGGVSDHEKALQKFFSTTLATLLRHMDLPSAPSSNIPAAPLLLASPGFTATSFQTYIKQHATVTANKPLLSLLSSILTVHTSTGHLHSLSEALASPSVSAKLSDAKYARETLLIDRFFTLLRQDDGRAWYGPREVERAVEKGAVGRGGGVLLISNALFRANEVGARKRWVTLVDRVRDVEGGEVRVLSESHESGKRLKALGEVAAILTFPLEGLDESDDEDTNENEADVVPRRKEGEGEEDMLDSVI